MTNGAGDRLRTVRAGIRIAVRWEPLAQRNADDARDETALIRRWLRSADEMLKRSVGKKGGEREPADADETGPSRPSKERKEANR